MHEHLKDLFERAFDDEPVFPDSDSARQVMSQGRSIRRRRRGLLIGGSTVAAVLVAVGVLNLVPALSGNAPQVAAAAQPQIPAAQMLIQQAEPQCSWSVPDHATDVAIFLKQDITGPQRQALRDSLEADPLVNNLVFESREDAYANFKALWQDSPDFVAAVDASQLPEAFRLNLSNSAQYPAFAAGYTGRPGIEQVLGGVCP